MKRGDDLLNKLAKLAGIFPQFVDLENHTRPISQDTQKALLRANGFDVSSAGATKETYDALRAENAMRILPEDVIISAAQTTKMPLKQAASWAIALERGCDTALSGRSQDGVITLPAVPPGLHDLVLTTPGGTQTVNLIASPGRAPAIHDLGAGATSWGMIAALYGLCSERNAGLGDFTDLAAVGRGLGAHGASFLGINPVHALGWSDHETISPYSPSHRGFLNTGHIALDDVFGAVDTPKARAASAEFIDYPGHGKTHRRALEQAFEAYEVAQNTALQASFDAFCADGGTALNDFARFEAISEHHGPDWRDWPERLQDVAHHGSAEIPDRIKFHKWLQWVADLQLAGAHGAGQDGGLALGLYLDLAVGARRGGAEAWCFQSAVASGVSVGAPPDQLSPAGQNWQLAGFAPHKLRADSYAPLRQVLAQTMRHCGVLRVDHALGMNRSYWIPDDGSPGGYIRQPFKSLMAIIEIEAHRAQTAIVGEDLGLVPDGFRTDMVKHGLYGYTVLQYEKSGPATFRNPDDLRAQSLACFGTHDTPTLRGYWEGHDIDWWQKLGWIPAEKTPKARADRNKEKAALLGTKTVDPAVHTAADLRDKVHALLADAPVAMVAVQLDDVLDIRAAQNLPGTIDEHPNWRRRYPDSVDEIAQNATLADTAKMMARAGRGAIKPKPIHIKPEPSKVSEKDI